MLLNRAILLTPPGAAAIAVIRISGDCVAEFARRHLDRPLAPSRPVHANLRDGEMIVDDPVVVLSEDGRSAELQLHGGPWVVEAMMQLLEREGFARSEATLDDFSGETLLEREMLAALPLALTEPALRMLLAQPAAWKDFVASSPTRESIEAVAEDVCLHRMLYRPRVAIVGPPNVGKSTLANQLFAQERSITADVPGTTRDWVGDFANIDGLAVMLVDTPGVRETDDRIERQAIDRSQSVVRQADLIINVIAPGDGGRLLHLPRADHGIEMIDVLNKHDLLRARGYASGGDAIATVATTGEGIGWLRMAIRTRFGCRDLTPNRPRWWTPRQREILKSATNSEKLSAL